MTFFLLITAQALGAAWLLSKTKPACETEATREAAAERFRKHWETKNWTPEMHGMLHQLTKQSEQRK
jgi:hypothetical protein